MTILDTTGTDKGATNEPIRFPSTREERRDELMRRRLRRNKLAEARLVAGPSQEPALPSSSQESTSNELRAEGRMMPRRRRFHISWTFASFLLMVGIPGALTAFYFAFIASPQYAVETQFSVRGSNQASMATLGLGAIFGSSMQPGDSYIVSSYIESVQLVRDVKEQLGIDLRQYYTKNNIDFVYHIDPNMPLEEFINYWRDMIEISFNSTTGNTTLYVYGFSPEDAKAIADAVLKVSENLVNNLSEKNRQQVTIMASKQVDRAEERLKAVREQIRQLRSTEKTLDPSQITAIESQLTGTLEGQLQALKTRQAALLLSVSADSPSARMIEKQITAAQQALDDQKKKIGDPNQTGEDLNDGSDRNVAEVLNKFEELAVEHGFATQAYTTALAAFETSLAEAQKMDRYFATFVAPTRPEIALYPARLLDTFIAFLVLLAVWMISQFLFRSFRDHAL